MRYVYLFVFVLMLIGSYALGWRLAPGAHIEPAPHALWATQLAKQTGARWEVWDVSQGEMEIRLACPPRYNTIAAYVIDVDLTSGEMRAIITQYPEPNITCAATHPK